MSFLALFNVIKWDLYDLGVRRFRRWAVFVYFVLFEQLNSALFRTHFVHLHRWHFSWWRLIFLLKVELRILPFLTLNAFLLAPSPILLLLFLLLKCQFPFRHPAAFLYLPVLAQGVDHLLQLKEDRALDISHLFVCQFKVFSKRVGNVFKPLSAVRRVCIAVINCRGSFIGRVSEHGHRIVLHRSSMCCACFWREDPHVLD